MKFEFRPDFRARPIFKGLKFKPEDYQRMRRTIAAILSVALLLILVLILAIKFL